MPYKEITATSPTFQFGYVHFKHNEEFSLGCDFTQNILVKKKLKSTNRIFVKCVKEKTFLYDGKPYEYSEVKCKTKPVINESIPITTTEEDPYAVAVARHNSGH